MALNFPNSPTNGQIYTDTTSGNRWSWDSANTCWKSTSTFTQTVTVAATAPGSPVVGQLWWNQDYGRLLVYYNDGTSSQWVDASPSDYTSYLAYGQANTVFGVANAAFGKANTALQNTSGTFSGDLTITGNVAVGVSTSSYPIGLGSYANGVKIALRGATNEYAIGTESNELKIASYSAMTFYTGGYAGTERARFDSSGNMMIGANTTTGDISNDKSVVGGVFSSINGTRASSSSGVSYSIVTLTSGVNRVYLLTVTITGADSGAGYTNVSLVRQASSGAVSITTLASAASLSVSVSGFVISATQSSGVSQTLTWNLMRIY